jgi:hypothetical protein
MRNTCAQPEMLFACGGHHLHRLELTNCSIPWESPLLCGLIHFRFSKSFSEIPIDVSQLLEALEKMLLLETLDLEGRLSIPPIDTKRAVPLSHITSLRLHSTAEGARFLNHISFPASTSLELRCQLHSANNHSTVCDVISSVWNGKGSKLLGRVQIQTLALLSMRLLGWTTSERTSKSAQIKVDLIWLDINDRTDDNVIIDLCSALTLTGLRTLSMDYVNLSKATWLSAFGHLTSLQTLRFRGFHAFEFLSALSTSLKENDDTGEIFLSGLQGLWLHRINFNATSHHPDYFGELQDCLMTRCHWNAGLQELYLRKCPGLYSDDVELLTEIVVDVDWSEA